MKALVNQRYFCARTKTGKEVGFLARKKISDSLLDGFRAESNREGEGSVPDVLRPVSKSPGGYGQWRKGQLCVSGDCKAGWHPLLGTAQPNHSGCAPDHLLSTGEL